MASADSMKKSRPFHRTAMALKQFSLDGWPLDFLFLFLHGYPPIVIMTWSVRCHPSHGPAPAFSHGACGEASGRFAGRAVSAAGRCLQKHGSCDAGAVFPPAERRGL